MQKIGRREGQLDRPPVVVHAHLLPVGGVALEVVPADRDARPSGQAAEERHGAARRLAGPDVRLVDLERAAGERADNREVVDDAAEEHVGVEPCEHAARVAERAGGDRRLVREQPLERRRVDVDGRR